MQHTHTRDEPFGSFPLNVDQPTPVCVRRTIQFSLFINFPLILGASKRRFVIKFGKLPATHKSGHNHDYGCEYGNEYEYEYEYEYELTMIMIIIMMIVGSNRVCLKLLPVRGRILSWPSLVADKV